MVHMTIGLKYSNVSLYVFVYGLSLVKQTRLWLVSSVNKCHLASHESIITLSLLNNKSFHGTSYFNLNFHVNTQRQKQQKRMPVLENITQIITKL